MKKIFFVYVFYMTNTEALASLIADVSTSLEHIRQDMAHDFHHPDWERAQLFYQEIQHLYAAGAYSKAFYACEELLELLEELEIQYMYWLEKNATSIVHDKTGQNLDLVTTHPDDIVTDYEEEVTGLQDRMNILEVPEDSRFYRVLYRNLLRGELVVLLVILSMSILLFTHIRGFTSELWYILTFWSIIALGIRLLRITRHTWGVVVLCVGILLTILGILFF